MKIRMTVEQPDGAQLNGQPWPRPGEVVELATAQAAHLVAAGVAEHATDTATDTDTDGSNDTGAKRDDDGEEHDDGAEQQAASGKRPRGRRATGARGGG